MATSFVPRLRDGQPIQEELERLAWAAGISFLSYGRRFGIRTNSPEILKKLPERLPPDCKTLRSPVVDTLYSIFQSNSRILLFLQSTRLARTLNEDAVLDVLEHSLHFNVAVQARSRLFVHAGVVGWRGLAIVIPGRSRSGKTALVEALVRAGAVYYSDEYAVLDGNGRVHPYAKRLYLRGEEGSDRRHVSIESLNGRRGTNPLPVGLVALAKYELGAHWRPSRLSPGKAMLALLDQTLLARRRPEFALETLRQVVDAGPVVLKGRRGEAGETARMLLEHLDAERRTERREEHTA